MARAARRCVLAAIAITLVVLLTGSRRATQQPERLGAGAAPTTTAQTTAARPDIEVAGFRVTYLPEGFSEVRRFQEPRSRGRVDDSVKFDDGTAVAPPEHGSTEKVIQPGRPADRVIVVTITSGGASPGEIPALASKLGGTMATIRGHRAVVIPGQSSVEMKWAEDGEHDVYISGRGVSEGELRQVAEGLIRA